MIKRKKENKGVTLIALVVTIVVLLILASVSINLVIGDNGIISKAKEAKVKHELANLKEEYNMFIGKKQIDDQKFNPNTLIAGVDTISYNTMQHGEKGSVYDILPSLKKSNYKRKIEIVKGKLSINTKDMKEMEIARTLDYKVNPFEIISGELVSSNGNLLLMDNKGILEIPETVTKIGDGAFANVEGLKSIVIPGNVKSIGANAFRNNPEIEKVIIEDGVESIGFSAFNSCTNLKEVIMPDSVTYLGSQAFYCCYNLNNVRLSENLSDLNSYTFTACGELKNIKIPEKIKTINSSCFSSCYKLNDIKIGKNITYIGNWAFNNCTSLKNIDTNMNNYYIYQNGMLMDINKTRIVFVEKSQIENKNIFTIPTGVEVFALDLSGNKNIETIEIPASLKTISPGEILPVNIKNIVINSDNPYYMVKDNCMYTKDGKSLKLCFEKGNKVNLINTLEKIEKYAFFTAPNLTELTLPESVKSVGYFCINNCRSLTKMYIGKNVNYIDPLFKYNIIKLDLTINPENLYFSVEDYILYNKNKTTLITTLNKSPEKFVIKDTVDTIGNYAFHNKWEVKEFVLPKGLKTINTSFMYCSFTDIVIPESVTSISSSAFAENKYLEHIRLKHKENAISGAPWGTVRGNRVVEWLK